MNTSEQAANKLKAGTVGGFHYGNEYKGCNGLYRATERVLPDGRQVFKCDVCGTEGARKPVTDNY